MIRVLGATLGAILGLSLLSSAFGAESNSEVISTLVAASIDNPINVIAALAVGITGWELGGLIAESLPCGLGLCS